MGDDNNCPTFVVQREQQLDDRIRRGGVEIAGGLVGQDKRRLADERPGNSDTLHLTAGQLVGFVPSARTEPDALEHSLGRLAPVRPGRAGVQQTVRHVVDHRYPRQEEEALEHETDAPTTDSR